LQEKDGIATKVCLQCKKQKQFESFYQRKRNKDGRENICKECKYNKNKKICELCAVIINEKFVKNFNPKHYKKIHGFCRDCRKKLRKWQTVFGGKRCTKCEISKPFGDFPFNKATYDNFDSWCKECRKKYTHEVKQSLDTHLRKCLARVRDDRRKLENNLDLQYLIDLWKKQKGKCAITGIVMEHKRNPRQHNLYNGSLDRINSAAGYLKGNVQWLCWMVNRMKGENSLEELLSICKKIIDYNT
jgi:hypothetical protein